jgi:NAD-reducing hydrogenase large subunit
MGRVVTIDPVTRIEGHARITIRLSEDGTVRSARFHVTEFRGFEEFCRGRTAWEMPSLTARTCGICPVSHLLASSKAADQIMGVAPPKTALALRTLVNLAQIVQSHALSFFHLSAPDLLLGLDSDPTVRNVFGLMAGEPELARRGIRLRAFGQNAIEMIAGRKVHSPGIVPGGVARALTVEEIERIRAGLPEALETATVVLELYRQVTERFDREIRSFGDFPSLFLGMANDEGTWEHHSGHLKIIDAAGRIVADGLDPTEYREWIGEASNPDSYLKSPYLKAFVPPGEPVEQGLYRVGPLARVNLCERMGTPVADEALGEFRQSLGRVPSSSFHYHHARLIEVIAALERMEALLADPVLTGPSVRAEAGINNLRGVGVSEAPRGTLFHEYEVDGDGLLTRINMIIATGQNNLAMNATVTQIAREFIANETPSEGALNRVEAGIRCYDPCLSCSTHAVGRMPLVVDVLDPRGHRVRRIARD